MSNPKEIEITYEPIAKVRTSKKREEISYKIDVALKPNQVSHIQIVSPFNDPVILTSILCENSPAKVWISGICGSVVHLKCSAKKDVAQSTGTVFVQIYDGNAIKK